MRETTSFPNETWERGCGGKNIDLYRSDYLLDLFVTGLSPRTGWHIKNRVYRLPRFDYFLQLVCSLRWSNFFSQAMIPHSPPYTVSSFERSLTLEMIDDSTRLIRCCSNSKVTFERENKCADMAKA